NDPNRVKVGNRIKYLRDHGGKLSDREKAVLRSVGIAVDPSTGKIIAPEPIDHNALAMAVAYGLKPDAGTILMPYSTVERGKRIPCHLKVRLHDRTKIVLAGDRISNLTTTTHATVMTPDEKKVLRWAGAILSPDGKIIGYSDPPTGADPGPHSAEDLSPQ